METPPEAAKPAITVALENSAPGQCATPLSKKIPFAPAELVPTEKRCIRCGEQKPISEFPLITPSKFYKNCVGKPSGVCKRCRHRQKYESMFRKFDREKAAYTLRKANEVQKIDAPHVAQQCEGVLKMFNGLEGYIKFWYGQIMDAAAKQPGSRLVLDHCREINKLIVNSTAHRNSAPDVQHMQPDEIEHEMRRIVLDLAREHPDDMMEVIDGVMLDEDEEADLEQQLLEEIASMEAASEQSSTEDIP